MAAQYLFFLDGTNYKLLPRTYHNSNPVGCVNNITYSTWFREFVKDVENQVLQFLYLHFG